MTYLELVHSIDELPHEEKVALLNHLMSAIDEEQADEPMGDYSLLEMAGVGAEYWDGIDAQEYINELRSEWDDRP